MLKALAKTMAPNTKNVCLKMTQMQLVEALWNQKWGGFSTHANGNEMRVFGGLLLDQ